MSLDIRREEPRGAAFLRSFVPSPLVSPPHLIRGQGCSTSEILELYSHEVRERRREPVKEIAGTWCRRGERGFAASKLKFARSFPYATMHPPTPPPPFPNPFPRSRCRCAPAHRARKPHIPPRAVAAEEVEEEEEEEEEEEKEEEEFWKLRGAAGFPPSPSPSPPPCPPGSTNGDGEIGVNLIGRGFPFSMPELPRCHSPGTATIAARPWPREMRARRDDASLEE
jgi:hypothetical protein